MVVDFRTPSLHCGPAATVQTLTARQSGIWRLDGPKIVHRHAAASEDMKFQGAGDLALRAVFQGRLVFRVAEDLMALEPGRVLATPARCPIEVCRHRGQVEESIVLFFDRQTLHQARFLRSNFDPTVFRSGKTWHVLAQIRESFRSGHTEAAALYPHFLDALSALGDDLDARGEPWRVLDIRQEDRARATYRRMEAAYEFVHARFREPVRLADVADAARLCPPYLLSKFRLAYGTTPMKLAARLRLEEAARQLQQTDVPVAEIGRRLSMKSAGTFSTRFAAYFGSSPREYRNRSRSHANIEEVLPAITP